MSRRLNLSDLNGDIYFILRRSNQQLARFLDTSQLDKYSDRLKHSREQMELTWLWARCRLGLTHDESALLFDQWLTIEEIEENFWDICRERYISIEDLLS